VRVEDGEGSVELRPCRELRVDCLVDFADPAIGRERMVVTVTPDSFASGIAPARTFGLLSEAVGLREHGLAAGATLDNCVVVDRGRVLSGRLRFSDEFVRHKVLDLLGDLALLGCPVAAEVVVRRAGHALRLKALNELAARPECWELVDGDSLAAPAAGDAEDDAGVALGAAS
jgi:UDP-3-O-[3-hydroxymyristoyl] N-acetylglucosamine deacetylase